MSKIYEFSLFNVDFQIELSDAEGGAPKPFKSRLTFPIHSLSFKATRLKVRIYPRNF